MANKKESISRYKKLIQNNKYLQYVIYSVYKEETGKLKNGMPNIGSFNESSMEKGGGNSTAFGAGQFITETRNKIKKKYGVDAWSQNREEQEAAIIALVEDRGYLAQVSNGEFRALASSGIWQAFDNPNSIINEYSDLTGWKEELEEFREGAKYEPQTSLRNIDPEVWAKKDSLYKKDGVSPLDVATEGSVASNLAQKEVDSLMAEYEKTLPKGIDKLSERQRLREKELDRLNKEYGLGKYETPDFKGVNWKNEAYSETNKKVFEFLGLDWDEEKTFKQNVEDNAGKENVDRAVVFEKRFQEKLLDPNTTFDTYESMYQEQDYNIFTNILYSDRSVAHILRDEEVLGFKEKGNQALQDIQNLIDNADKFNLNASQRRELQNKRRQVESSLEQADYFSSVGTSGFLAQIERGQFDSDVDKENIEVARDSMQSHLDIFSNASKYASEVQTPERIKSDVETEAGIGTGDKKTTPPKREKSGIISLATKGVESIETEGAEQTPIRQDMSSVPVEPIKNAKLKLAADKIGSFLQDSGITGESVSNALRAGAGLLSLYNATKKDKVNQQKVSPLMLEAVNQAKELAKVGMPYEQKMAAIKDLNNAYAGAMKNVMAISGGQRGAALASMGAVDASRVNALVDLAAKSSDMRAEGMKMFQQAAGDYSKLKLTADMGNEELRAKLEDSRKERMLKAGSTLYEQAMEFNRNFKDETYNKELISAIQGLQGAGGGDDDAKRAEELRQETIVGGFEDFTIPGTNFVVTKKDN